MTDHWMNYEPIEGVASYDANAAVSRSASTLQVVAKVAGVELATPIGLVVLDVCSLALTIEQSAAIRSMLERAERDARAGLEAAAGVARGTERGRG
jgi:hypothetical protein